MATETLTTYEMWEVTVPTIPARSRLYPLEPIGMGTPQVESLSSYLARLAEGHSVLLSKLVRREILPCFGRPHLRGNITAFWMNYARAMNGLSRWAKDLVQVLEELTKQPDLHLLTLLPWSEVLNGRGLLRRNRAWNAASNQCGHLRTAIMVFGCSDRLPCTSTSFTPLLLALSKSLTLA
jgi:hypothetical protein